MEFAAQRSIKQMQYSFAKQYACMNRQTLKQTQHARELLIDVKLYTNKNKLKTMQIVVSL